ncbi:hemolysin family protein [Corynebacterium coyleae]|uniref:hemolysin family protein n=1 Tax=Corynebacterium coyleae TaxID=53374 RepID=UPI00254E7685|nr:hemolysin family protein [Corynebacterium coyleae]MDK8240796.1 hemolysin family protein [Corynebacterium coyleae]
MSIWLAVVLIVALLAANAFFVGAEFALVSSRRDRLESLQAQGKTKAQDVMYATEHLSIYLAGAQFGITVASLILGKVAEPAIAKYLEEPFLALGVPADILHPISFVIALAFISFLHILFGEMVPKNIAIAGPEQSAMWLTRPMTVWMKLTRPVLEALNWVARKTLAAFGIQQRDELDSTVDQEQLATMIQESRKEGLLDAEETVRLAKALRQDSRSLNEVLIPLEEVKTIPYDPRGIRLSIIEQAVQDTGFSRFPVLISTGSLAGYLHVKDILDLMETDEKDPRVPLSRIRPLITVDGHESMDDALTLLHRRSAHMAAVHENGRLVGIVALEDLIEEYVGTVSDWTHENE